MEKKLEVVGIVDPNGYEIRNRVYGMRGGLPTISARDYKDPPKIIRRWRGCIQGNYDIKSDENRNSKND